MQKTERRSANQGREREEEKGGETGVGFGKFYGNRAEGERVVHQRRSARGGRRKHLGLADYTKILQFLKKRVRREKGEKRGGKTKWAAFVRDVQNLLSLKEAQKIF